MEAGQGKVARAHVPSPNMDVLDGEKGLLSKSLDRNLSMLLIKIAAICFLKFLSLHFLGIRAFTIINHSGL